jgi:nucleoside-diphosphate-sugar epimerase
MIVFVVGATGAIGRPLITQLVAGGRDVTPALVDAAREAGALRVIAQSAAFMTAPVGPTSSTRARLSTSMLPSR